MALLELALHYGGSPLSTRTIARRRSLPVKYLERLLQRLRQAGLVVSTRGAGGGYSLARRPSEVTVGDVLEALEGMSPVVSCIDAPERCDQVATCATRDVWLRVQSKVSEVLQSISLADLVATQLTRQRQLAIDYCI